MPVDRARPQTFLDHVAVAVAATTIARAIVLVPGVIGRPVDANPVFPAWFSLWLIGLFSAVGGLLAVSGRGDRRAWPLGAYCLAVAASLAEPIVIGNDRAWPLALAAAAVRVDAFHAALIWYFALAFPAPAESPRLRRVMTAGGYGSILLGVVLFVANWLPTGIDGAFSTVSPAVAALSRHSPHADWFFSLQYAAVMPLLFLLPAKLRSESPDARRRLAALLSGLAVAVISVFWEALATTLWPGFLALTSHGWGRFVRVAIPLVGLTQLPLVLAYAALVQRTLPIRHVLRQTVQYLLAVSTVRLLPVLPALGFVILASMNRDRTLVELAGRPEGVVLGGLAVFSVTVLAFRHRILEAIDSRFFRSAPDVREVLLSLNEAMRSAGSVEEFVQSLEQALQRTFQPLTLTVGLAARGELVSMRSPGPPSLPAASPIAQLAASSDRPLDVQQIDVALRARLPPADRAWLDACSAVLVVPMRSHDAQLRGLIALGPRKSEMPYREADLRLLATVGGASALALDRLLQPASTPEAELAAECIECGRVLAMGTPACPCGAPAQRAVVPAEIRGQFAFTRRLGAGANGVVYEAVDLVVRQRRAVKALPGSEPVLIARARREARAMAAAEHPNLARLHSLSDWNGVPLLVMELCDQGTLADRLHRGPLSDDEVRRVGQGLLAGVGHLHERGMLHRDIKPSNVGFSAGVVKLLDFGLTRLMEPRAEVCLPTGVSTWTESVVGDSGVAVRGTPAYLSPQTLSGRPPSASDDLWSLCLTLLEAATGVNPFKAVTTAETVSRILSDANAIPSAVARAPTSLQGFFAEVLSPADASARSNAARVSTLLSARSRSHP